MKWLNDFLLRRKRISHVKSGHPFNESVLLDKMQSDRHPHNDAEYIYTVNIMYCHDCGLTWNDEGLERRKKP